VDGKSFLGTAQLLLNNGGDEAAHRSAISRAYYACFLSVRETAFRHCDPDVRKRNFRKERDVRHSLLTNCCTRPGVSTTILKLGKDLDALRGNRENADYEMLAHVSFRDAEQAVEEAQALLEDLRQIRPNEIGKALEDHIKAICRTT